MIVIGLTGGIGSGKSTVSAMLSERGATVIDADKIAREILEPDGQAYRAVADRFGSKVLCEDGSIDRSALATIVFEEPAALAELEKITHPAVAAVMAEQLSAEAGSDHVVVLDVPLLVETLVPRAKGAPPAGSREPAGQSGPGQPGPGQSGPVFPSGGSPTPRNGAFAMAGVIVVDTPAEVAIERVIAGRGMRREEVTARTAAQAGRQERLAAADFVIDNSGSMEHLRREVDRAMEWIQGLRSERDPG